MHNFPAPGNAFKVKRNISLGLFMGVIWAAFMFQESIGLQFCLIQSTNNVKL